MTPQSLSTLYHYSYWAVDKLWECIEQLTDEEFTRPLNYSTGSIRHHLVHMMSSTQRWFARIEGVALPPHLAFEDYATRQTTQTKWHELSASALTYITSLTQAQLDEPVTWEIANRNLRGVHHRWELLLHVANHATDHRAQILAMLHQHFGKQTVEQDMIFYLADRANSPTDA